MPAIPGRHPWVYLGMTDRKSNASAPCATLCHSSFHHGRLAVSGPQRDFESKRDQCTAPVEESEMLRPVLRPRHLPRARRLGRGCVRITTAYGLGVGEYLLFVDADRCRRGRDGGIGPWRHDDTREPRLCGSRSCLALSQRSAQCTLRIGCSSRLCTKPDFVTKSLRLRLPSQFVRGLYPCSGKAVITL